MLVYVVTGCLPEKTVTKPFANGCQIIYSVLNDVSKESYYQDYGDNLNNYRSSFLIVP